LELADCPEISSKVESGELARIWAMPEFGQYSAGLNLALSKEPNRSIATALRSFRLPKLHQVIFFFRAGNAITLAGRAESFLTFTQYDCGTNNSITSAITTPCSCQKKLPISHSQPGDELSSRISEVHASCQPKSNIRHDSDTRLVLLDPLHSPAYRHCLPTPRMKHTLRRHLRRLLLMPALGQCRNRGI
jgi:hypothetical protein